MEKVPVDNDSSSIIPDKSTTNSIGGQGMTTVVRDAIIRGRLMRKNVQTSIKNPLYYGQKKTMIRIIKEILIESGHEDMQIQEAAVDVLIEASVNYFDHLFGLTNKLRLHAKRDTGFIEDLQLAGEIEKYILSTILLNNNNIE